MNAIDLKLQSHQSGAGLSAFVSSPSTQDSFLAPWPTEALEWQQEWKRQFLTHHDPAAAAVSADAVRDYGNGLSRSLHEWLLDEACRPLRLALAAHPGLPLRVRISGAHRRDLEYLPWEVMAAERTIWRLVDAAPSGPSRPMRPHRPRLLLLVGSEDGLSLDREVDLLARLQRQGRLELHTLRGPGSNLAAIRRELLDPRGWDGLVFLGHSEAEVSSGGRLHLGDSSWVSAEALKHELQRAAQQGLALVLLNSCSGLDLARSCAAAGVPWTLCFREPVPCMAASLAFCSLLGSMESGADLLGALQEVRKVLRIEGPVGSDLLLSLVATPRAEAYRLPLRKHQQLLLRLSSSTARQAVAATVLVVIAGVGELDPATPLNSYLLDRRLYVQRLWRHATGQPGPKRKPLPVLVLNQNSAATFGAETLVGRVSRDLLAKVLQRISVQKVSSVGLDLVLDEPAPHSEKLAQVIAAQRRALVFAGFLGKQVEGNRVGKVSMPLPILRDAGLQARDLAVGTPAIPGTLKWAPLQLWQPINSQNFAGTLAGGTDPLMPADAVLDWSVDWRTLLQRIEPQDLPGVEAPVLLVGSDGTLDRDGDDLFAAPGAMDPALADLWGGAQHKVPGVLVQAVIAQSLRLGHWLTPASQSLSTALGAGLGVLLAASEAKRGRRFWILCAITLVAMPLAWQLAVSALWLVPLCLPLAALASTALLRHD